MSPTLRMFAVLSSITLVSGAALGGLYEATHERAENNILRFKKIPAVVDIYARLETGMSAERRVALEEELLADKRYADIGADEPLLLFVVRRDGEPYAVTLEQYGQGFGGDLGVMVGFRLDGGDLLGIGVTTMSETPGVGTAVRDSSFTAQFAGLGPDAVVKVKKDGGVIDAVSGATISSRAVSEAVRKARAVWEEHQAVIRTAVEQPAAAGEGDVASAGGRPRRSG